MDDIDNDLDYSEEVLTGFWNNAKWLYVSPDGGKTVYRIMDPCHKKFLDADGRPPKQLYIKDGVKVGFDYNYGR